MKRKVLLTIDDSPSPLMAQRLDYLRPLGIRILWFCRGDNLSERPDVGIQALRDGHVLGNHSWDHPRFSQLTLEQCRDQIDRTDSLLDDIHRQAGVPRTVKCFRFPYEDRIGSDEHHEALQDLLRSRGFEPALLPSVPDRRFRERDDARDLSWPWSFDLEDWTLKSSDSPDAASALQNVLARLDREISPRRNDLEVFVGHDHAHTVGQWEAILLHLIDLDCEFLSPLEARAV